MANDILNQFYYGADLFDVMGTETDWLNGESFSPLSDNDLMYKRILSNQKPYCLLMNTYFTYFTHEYVEQYFQICLFYGYN